MIKSVFFAQKLEILNREMKQLVDEEMNLPDVPSNGSSCVRLHMASNGTMSLVMHAILSDIADEHYHFHASKKLASKYTVTMVQDRLEKLQFLRDFVFDHTGPTVECSNPAADIILELVAHIGAC